MKPQISQITLIIIFLSVKSLDNPSMEKDRKTNKIIGGAMEVLSLIVPGNLEAVYHECLDIEFKNRKISFADLPIKEYPRRRKFTEKNLRNQ